MVDAMHIFHTWWLCLREVAFLSVELMLRCWVSVLEDVFFVRGTEKLWLFCSSVIWSYRSLGKKSQVMVEYVELGTNHLHPRMLQDGILHPASLSRMLQEETLCLASPLKDAAGKDSVPTIPSQGCYRKGFCVWHPLSRILQEGILCLASPSRILQEGRIFPPLCEIWTHLMRCTWLVVVCHVQIHYWLHKLYGLAWEPNHLWFCVLRNYILT